MTDSSFRQEMMDKHHEANTGFVGSRVLGAADYCAICGWSAAQHYSIEGDETAPASRREESNGCG